MTVCLALAEQVRRSGTDAKWTRLAELLRDGEAEMFDEAGKRRKLIISLTARPSGQL